MQAYEAGRPTATPFAADATRAGGAAFGREWTPQQAGCGGTGDQRDHAADSSQQHHEENGGRVASRAGPDGGDARDTFDGLSAHAQMIDLKRVPNQPAAAA